MDEPQTGSILLTRAVRQQLESLARAGVEQLPRAARTVEAGLDLREIATAAPPRSEQVPGERTPSSVASSVASRTPGSVAPPEPIMPAKKTKREADPAWVTTGHPPRLTLKRKKERLEHLCEQVTSCRLCPELAAQRTQTVFGVGNPNTRLCFFGEAPGADEDRQGEPFVGRAGQLLDKIIEACSLKRRDVYILNTVKCRPPGNRNPEPEEVANCRPFFEEQLEVIRPEFICCLGAVAAKALLDSKLAIGKLRGQLHAWRWAKVLVTYHPAYLLRNPSAKRDVWEDMKLLMREMGVEL